MAAPSAEALRKSTEYFGGDDLAANVFLTKYALPGEDTPEAMHRRLAKEFARIEAKYPNPLSEDEIFYFFDHFKYIVPQGSPMAGIGNKDQVMSLSNCFTIDSPWDSYSGILKTDQEQAQLMKRRGGVGFDISTLRPKDVKVSNAAGTTDGIAVFMERYSNTTREVAQSGRRGALMLTIDVRHPDIETFTTIKSDLKKITGANISIQLTDAFMKAVQNDEDFVLQWPVDSPTPTITKTIKAADLWDIIITQAHATAEPGLLFWDTVRRRSPADIYPDYHSVSVNPCAEITLSGYDSCRLLLINAASFVNHPFNGSSFDIDKFEEVAKIGQRLMDDMVDLELECIDRILAKIESDPEPEDVKRVEFELWGKIRDACKNGRRTGLGLTGIGDAVAAMSINYGSQEGIDFIEYIYKHLALNSYRSSVNMAKERGAFPAYDYGLEKNHEFINQIMDLDPQLRADWAEFGRRNIANTTTPPAGSVSLLTQTTSGIENAYLLSYVRRKKHNPNDVDATIDFVDEMGDKWQEFPVYHHYFKKWMEVSGKTDPAESPYAGATSADIDWVMKVKAQAAAQKWVDHAISSTTNLPNDASVDMVKQIYMTGWESGCKGLTVYRDGCRSGVLVASTEKNPKNTSFKRHDSPKRPKELPCDIYNMTVLGEKWTFFIGLLEDKPYEIMGGLTKYVKIPKRVKKGKIVKLNGANHPIAQYELHYDYELGPDDEAVIGDITNIFDNATYAAFTRTLSLSLRHGTDVQYVVEQLQKGSEKEDDLFSFSKGASRVLKHYIQDGTKSDKKCLDCGDKNLSYQDGCVLCLSCGSSKCS